MGAEYALVHDETNEAFELGKGWWLAWKEPTSIDDVRAYVTELLAAFPEYWGNCDGAAWIDPIWEFARTHPGCRLVSDTADDHWRPEPDYSEEKAEVEGHGERLYLRVGSLYADATPHKGKGQ